jgi:hypothetical protein
MGPCSFGEFPAIDNPSRERKRRDEGLDAVCDRRDTLGCFHMRGFRWSVLLVKRASQKYPGEAVALRKNKRCPGELFRWNWPRLCSFKLFRIKLAPFFLQVGHCRLIADLFVRLNLVGQVRPFSKIDPARPCMCDGACFYRHILVGVDPEHRKVKARAGRSAKTSASRSLGTVTSGRRPGPGSRLRSRRRRLRRALRWPSRWEG